MTPADFNQSTLIPRYSYAPSPVNARAFMIMERDDVLNDPKPIGDYTVLDKDEDLSLSEKKVKNLLFLMNGKKEKLLDLGEEATGRTHFQVIDEKDRDNNMKIMYYVQKREGVSKENALLRIESDHVQ